MEKSGRLPYAERAEREAERPARRAPVRRTFDRGFSMGSAAAPASAGAPAPDWKSPAAGRGPAGGALPGFRMGDSVQHKAFGRGLITKVTPMGGDAPGGDRLRQRGHQEADAQVRLPVHEEGLEPQPQTYKGGPCGRPPPTAAR